MIQIDKETKEKRNAEYNMKARKYPAYLSLAIPIMLGVAMGVKDMEGAGIWIKVLTYLISISAISTALFFLLRFSLRSIAKFYPERILFCDRLKPTARILYSNDNTYTEEQKANIREKILAKKKIDLRKYKPKTFKNKKYVKRVDEAVNWLLDVTRFDDILFDYNCIYGFYRNLTAAIFLDGIVLFILAAINIWGMPLPLGHFFLWGGIICVIVSFITTWFAYTNGRRYAKRLYNVFLNLDDDKNNY